MCGRWLAKRKVEIMRGSNVLLLVAALVCCRITAGCGTEGATPIGAGASAADTLVGETSPESPTDVGPDLPEVSVEVPSAEDAFSHLWYVLTKMPFYNANGYQVALPDHAEFLALAEDGVDGQTDESYYFDLFAEEVYSADEYAAGLAAVQDEMHTVRAALPAFKQVEDSWGFVLHDPYLVRLTLYGPGGSYDPVTGMVVLMTTPQGTFKRPNPAHTVVHEMVHMGVQHLVEQFELTHSEKERLVDLFCLLTFAEIMPGYQGQSIGDVGLDPYVTKQAIEQDLPAALAAYAASES
jgi:hypothetical protein